MGFNDWLGGLLRAERLERYPGTGILAYFWDGSAPIGHTIKDISLSGAFIHATQRWYPGTILDIALREVKFPTSKTAGEAVLCSLRCKVIWHGTDGMGVAFIVSNPAEKLALKKLVSLTHERTTGWEPIRVILPRAE